MSRILIIEDSPTQAQLFTLMLEDAGFEVERAERLADGLRRIEQGGIDALLLDLKLPDSEGLQTVVAARRGTPHTPIVVLTNVDDESLAAAALQEGARDYLVKGEVNQNWLVRSVQQAIAPDDVQDVEATTEQKAERKPEKIFDVTSVGAVSVVRFCTSRLFDARDTFMVGEMLIGLVDSGCRKMLISFANVDYVSNGALSALVAGRKKMLLENGEIRLCDLRKNVYEQLSVRQFHRLFDIREDEASAMKSLETD